LSRSQPALATPGVRFMTVLLGINDIGFGGSVPTQAVTADEIIAAHRQLIARAHSRGIRIYGCTLTPFNGVAPLLRCGGRRQTPDGQCLDPHKRRVRRRDRFRRRGARPERSVADPAGL
jgi:lysophospholipase L1-like esterase